MRGNTQKIEVECIRCRKRFQKILSGTKDVSSLSFPIYKIQRYKDYDSPPKEINLCSDCSDKLDRFLYIYTDGQDYYKDFNDMEDTTNE